MKTQGIVIGRTQYHSLAERHATVGHIFQADIEEEVDLGDGDGYAARVGYGEWRVTEVKRHDAGDRYWVLAVLIRIL